MISRGLVADALEAEKLVLSQRVWRNGKPVRFAGESASEDDLIRIIEDKKYISRAGEKLDFALNQFGLKVDRAVCVDVGVSTGGFCGVLLDKGAKKIYAVDVARGEIAWKLRTDPRVVLMERTNARDLISLPEPIDFVSVDVSFISVALILPNIRKWIKPEADVVVLVKPQFEAPRELVGKGGIITESSTHKLVLEKFFEQAEQSGFKISGLCPSPIKGAEGNKEFLAWISIQGSEVTRSIIDTVLC